MIKVGILGTGGYVAKELIRLLLNHPDCHIECLVSESSEEGKNIGEIFPTFRKLINKNTTKEFEALFDCEAVLTSKPDDNSIKNVPILVEQRCRVIDLSAAYRFRNAHVYETTYNRSHTSKELLKEAVYGLTELYGGKIKSAKLVANPGCYPVSVILACAPLLKEQLVDPDDIIVDSYSGVSGAGADPKPYSDYLFCELMGNLKPYKVCEHRHAPEIEQELGSLAQCKATMTFVPHLAPLKRGILSSSYLKLEKSGVSPSYLRDLYADFYKDKYFVRIMKPKEAPSVSNVAGTNFCDIGIFSDRRTSRVVVISAIDNLIKGAAGQAIQNLNVMFGLDETSGLVGVNAETPANMLDNITIEKLLK